MKISIVKMDDYGQVFYIEYCPEENGFKILDKFINENMKYFRYNKCNTSNEWYRGDPNISLMPW
jgi:hypothetical protein